MNQRRKKTASQVAKGARLKALKAERLRRTRAEEEHDLVFQKTLAEGKRDPLGNITFYFTDEYRKGKINDGSVSSYGGQRLKLPDPIASFIEKLSRKSMRLVEAKEMHTALFRVAMSEPRIREIDTWKPRGKGVNTHFVSLCNHLFAQYQVPQFVWSAFFDEQNKKLADIVVEVAAGGSLYKIIKEPNRLPIPFNRRMVHDLMTTTSSKYTFVEGIRRAQVRNYGGNELLLRSWLHLIGRRIMSPGEEAFWDTVLRWFAQNPMLDPEQYGPIIDYIRHQRAEEPGFSMKGRGALALLRAMEQWHKRLSMIKDGKNLIFSPSGIAPFKADKPIRKKDGNFETRIWRIREIRSSNELAAEGRKMRHCVYSYASSIERGLCSIWSLSFENGVNDEKRRITIEVRHKPNLHITQRRGFCNRVPKSDEDRVIYEWAQKEGIAIAGNYW